jgi:hypothetical protein
MIALTENLCHHSRQTEWSLLCTATLGLVLDDRNEDDLIKMDHSSIVSATRRKASHEAPRSNVQACSKPARELTRGDKREVTALGRKLIVPQYPNSTNKGWARGFFVLLPKDLVKKARS